MNKVNPDPIEWTDPPPRGKKKQSVWVPVAEALRARPGQWAKIVNGGNTGIAQVIKHGHLVCFRPAGSFEAQVSNLDGNWSGDVYARYIGPRREHE